MDKTLTAIYNFKVMHPRGVLHDQYIWYKIISAYTILNLLEVLVAFLAINTTSTSNKLRVAYDCIIL